MIQFVKDYGVILSPTIAFLLGIITVFIKCWIDGKIQKKQAGVLFEKAKEMLSKIQLPDYCKGPRMKDPHRLMHAAMARNLTNISRMYFLIAATYKYLLSLEKNINQSQNFLIINQYFYLVWRIEQMIKKLETIRENSEIDEATWCALQHEIPELLDFLNDDWFSLKSE